MRPRACRRIHCTLVSVFGRTGFGQPRFRYRPLREVRLVGRTVLTSLIVGALTGGGPALAQQYLIPVSIGAAPLSQSLQTLQRQTGIELLYDSRLVTALQSPPVVGSVTPEDALRQLLAETGLTVRRASSGAWIIERQATPPLAQQDAAVAEILEIGRAHV